ncbi:MAG TPA: thioesterase family protein [Pilimelia sp.]|nr:thioesterase family protein [Pilimelia sp.]
MTTVLSTAAVPAVDYGHVEPVTVHFDDLDALGMLHNSRYAVLLERALTPYWAARGHSFDGGRPTSPDVFHAVRQFTITYRTPIRGTGEVAVHFWLEHFGETSGRYGFRFLSPDGTVEHAHGERAIVRVDPATLRPAPWTDAGRSVAATLMRPRPE